MALLSPEACLFIANLPSQFSNDELTYHLLETFKRFGIILSVKASRDSRGRPFGFVQFESPTDAGRAMQHGKSYLGLCGRKIRVEKARCLRKIMITMDAIPIQDLHKFKNFLIRYARPEDIVIIHQKDEWTIDQMDAIAVFPERSSGADLADPWLITMKLLDHLNADQAYQDIQKAYPDWTLEWYNVSQKLNGSSSFSGEVCEEEPLHRRPLVVSLTKELDLRMSQLSVSANEQTGATFNLSPNSRKDETHTPQSRSSTEEQDNNPFTGDDEPKGSEKREVFIGRLNNQKVDENSVFERFSKYGDIEDIHMVNRKLIAGSIPQDAFAFILYHSHDDARKAIDHENGKYWYGQAIKVNWAMNKPHSSSISHFFPSDMSYTYSPLQKESPERVVSNGSSTIAKAYPLPTEGGGISPPMQLGPFSPSFGYPHDRTALLVPHPMPAIGYWPYYSCPSSPFPPYYLMNERGWYLTNPNAYVYPPRFHSAPAYPSSLNGDGDDGGGGKQQQDPHASSSTHSLNNSSENGGNPQLSPPKLS